MREERDVVEGAYMSGAIRVIAATMTLAAGVNLPARRVVLKHHWVGQTTQWLSTTQVQQMAGRAGRAGLDTTGEVVLLCPPRVRELAPYANLLTVSDAAPRLRKVTASHPRPSVLLCSSQFHLGS